MKIFEDEFDIAEEIAGYAGLDTDVLFTMPAYMAERVLSILSASGNYSLECIEFDAGVEEDYVMLVDNMNGIFLQPAVDHELSIYNTFDCDVAYIQSDIYRHIRDAVRVNERSFKYNLAR